MPVKAIVIASKEAFTTVHLLEAGASGAIAIEVSFIFQTCLICLCGLLFFDPDVEEECVNVS